MNTVKEHIKGNVKFLFYRDEQLFYETSLGMVFPVSIKDIDKGTFLAEDKGILFMRYIRKHLESIKNQTNAET